MRPLRLFLLATLLLCALVLPLGALAQVPIGGKVVGTAPCKGGPGYIYVVAGFGIGSGVFWYLPATLSFPYGPPRPGQWVLGLASIAPGMCGLPTVMQGSSLAI